LLCKLPPFLLQLSLINSSDNFRSRISYGNVNLLGIW
jgi:hypothetical protein